MVRLSSLVEMEFGALRLIGRPVEVFIVPL